MTEAVALFLRGVNVGGKGQLPMRDLARVMTEELGCSEVKTYLQSGNVVVRDAPDGLDGTLRARIHEHWDLDVEVFAFTPAELASVVSGNPEPDKAAAEPKKIHVALLQTEKAAAWVSEVGEEHGADRLAAGPRCVYLSYSQDSRNSPLATVLRRAPFAFTARNWNTVTKMVDLVTD